MTTILYQGKYVDFKDVFYAYAKVREGYRVQVYKDIYGNDTVGIGHKVTGAEPMALTAGTVLSDRQVRELFNMDYDRLKIEGYVAEIQAAGYSYNMMLAVGYFIWMHGDGQYKISDLRGGLLNRTFTEESLQRYLTANWDNNNPELKPVNRKTFALGFSSIPWETGITFSLAERLTWLFPSFSDFVKNNKVAVSVMALILLAIIFYCFRTYFIN